MNRREFARTTVLASAAAASGIISVRGAEQKRIRTGLIGCGSVSNAYLSVLTQWLYLAARRSTGCRVPGHWPRVVGHAGAGPPRSGDHHGRAGVARDGQTSAAYVDFSLAGGELMWIELPDKEPKLARKSLFSEVKG